ncbi:MAG: SRPBCC family protein [Acidobacteriota bacterium]
MPTIVLETDICATPETCFDLIRDERIYAGPAAAIFGDLGPGQTITFRSTFFGMTQKLTVKVVEYERPRLLVDEMIEGNFRSFRHMHEFTETENGIVMTDTLIWELPLGILGQIVDRLLLEGNLTRLVSTRNTRLKAIAESHRA